MPFLSDVKPTGFNQIGKVCDDKLVELVGITASD